MSALTCMLSLQCLGFAQSTVMVPATDGPRQTCAGAACSGVPGTGQLSSPEAPGPAALPSVLGPEPISSRVPTVLEPPAPATEFQDFVTTSVGRKLPMYGYSLFDRVPSTFAPLDRVPVTADYVIGPGDELLIRAWGQIDLDAKVIVDRKGEVYLPKIGILSVAGLKYQQLQNYCKAAVGRVFRNFDLSVSLGQLRSIQVYVVGQARRPGSYTVGSLSTLVNTLFASGGPSGSGSMRHIQLKRQDTLISDFDFYDLLLKGDKSKDAQLLPGDVIYIPPVGSLIAVAGSVNVPAIYELKDQASLRQAIDMAGGLTTTADGQKAIVERIENRSTRKVEEFPLDEEGLQRQVTDGDVVRVFSLSPRFDNAVTLRGNVAHPGRYEWRSGLRIKDLIPGPEALMTRDYWRDMNSISALSEIQDSRQEHATRQQLQGMSANPDGLQAEQDPNWHASMRTSPETTNPEFRQPEFRKSELRRPDLRKPEFREDIKHGVPEINWDYAVIQRLNPVDLTMQLIPFNLGKLVLEGDQENNLALAPGDIITIFSQADLAVPLEKRTKFVRLEGEFRAAGIYRVEPGETLRQLVARAGGSTVNAYFYGAEFTREAVRIEQQKGLDRLRESVQHDIAQSAVMPGSINPEDVAEKRAQVEAQRQLADKLAQVKATGRVVLELKLDAAGVEALPDMLLEDGDRFLIPYRPSTVDVLGETYNNNSFLYRPDKRLGDYLKQAGGTTRDADKARIFVIRADGAVLSKQSVSGLWNGGFNSIRLMPGDAIVVPPRLRTGTTLRALKDWTQVFSQFALGVAAVRTINRP
jgi:protein involved in polysaccharide export with SLBB domain